MKKLFYILSAVCLSFFSNDIHAQETVVSIGTGTSVSNGPPARPSSESYGQTLYYPAQIGMSGYITKLVYKRYDTQPYTNAMHWTVYLGTTTQTSFFGSLNYDDMIPVGNLTQVFDGNVEVTSTEVIVSFETPFYYDGVDQLVVAVNELTLGKHYSYLKATSYGTQTNAPAKAAINISTFASVNASSPLASSDQMQATAEQANVDITFSTCLWPTAVTATNPTTTTMQVGWTASALNETAWQVEAVPTGEAQGTGIVQNAGTNPYTFTGLDHSTVYDFYVRSDCGSNEYSEWKNFGTGTTECGINTCLDLDFDSYNHLEEPRCFTTIGAVGTGTAVGNPGDLFLHVGGSLPAYVSLPEVASLNGGILNFRARSNVNQSPYNQVIVGTMSDPNNNATFTALTTLTLSTTWSNESVDFGGYAGTDKYITFYYANAINGNSFVYVDDITFDGNGACVFNKTFVDKDATGNNDGTSWTDAYTDLQDALTNYNGNDIWVAEGTYKPHASDRAATFSIPSGANIYGGFAGTETAVNQRIAGSNTTILSGDLSDNDNTTLLDTEPTRQDNSYHIITLKGDVQNVVLDGFTVSSGNANGPVDNSCGTAAANRVYHTRGAAIYANPYVINQINSAEVSNCIFENHTATEVSVYYAFAPCGVTNITFDFDFDRCITRNNFCGTLSTYLFTASGGYGIVSQGSVTNSLFHDNETTASIGSVFYMVTSTANGGTSTALNLDILNNTFANNVSGDGSTFYTIRAQSSTFTNNIVWGNGSTVPFNASPTPVISTANLIEGGLGGSLNVNPDFTDAGNDDYTLSCTSDAIGFGDGTGIDPASLDLAGNARFNGDLDLGAYENQSTFSASASVSTLCQGEPVTLNATGVTNISWTGGVTNGVPFYPSSTATYSVTGTDASGCIDTRDVLVTVDASVSDDNVTAQSEVCSGTSTTVNVAGSTLGATYYLRNNSNNSVVDGPTTGTGNALAFSTGSLTSSTTFNVFAEGSAIVTQDGALEFDGVDDYVLAPKPSGLAYNSAYTVEGWVKTPNPGASGGYQAIFFAGTTAASDIEVYVQQGTNNLVVVHNRGNGGTLQGATFPVPPNNTWFHLAVVYNGSTVTAYFDGVSQGSIAIATPVVSGGAEINFGYMQSSAFNPAWGSKNMAGSLDDFRLWSTARSAGDIASEMGNCVAGTETGLEAYYNFEDGTGTTLTDLANSNNGTLINMDNSDWVATGSVSCTGAGCDFQLSQTVTVGVTNGYNLTESASACNGESYTFPDGSSQVITTQTVYTSNLTTVVAGCDSIIETTVDVNPSYDLTESATVCSGESYTFPDGSTQQNITSQVVYTSNLATVLNSCDSIIETTVNVSPTYSLTESASVCSGESFTFPDGSIQTITSQVVHTSNLLTVGAQCDSIIETTVNVAPEYNLTETVGLCSGADFTFPDGTSQSNITAPVVYTSNLVTVGSQCDSIIETTLTITSAFNVSETASVCSGASYTFPDGSVQNNITSQVVYSSTLSAISIPCDSIVETTVNIASEYNLTETETVCFDGSFTFPDGTTQNNITSQVVYTSNLFTAATQCDSIIETTVNVTTVDASTTQNGNTLTATETGADYQWVDCDNGNAPINGEENQAFTPTSSGNYAVEVTVNGCTETSGCTNMVVTGIAGIESAKVWVYPIPAREVLNVDYDGEIQAISIYSASGALISTYSQNPRQIDVSKLSNGMYILRIETETGRSQTRFVKE